MITDFTETVEELKDSSASLNDVVNKYRDTLITGVAIQGTFAYQIDRVVREIGQVMDLFLLLLL